MIQNNPWYQWLARPLFAFAVTSVTAWQMSNDPKIIFGPALAALFASLGSSSMASAINNANDRKGGGE